MRSTASLTVRLISSYVYAERTYLHTLLFWVSIQSGNIGSDLKGCRIQFTACFGKLTWKHLRCKCVMCCQIPFTVKKIINKGMCFVTINGDFCRGGECVYEGGFIQGSIKNKMLVLSNVVRSVRSNRNICLLLGKKTYININNPWRVSLMLPPSRGLPFNERTSQSGFVVLISQQFALNRYECIYEHHITFFFNHL